MGRPQKRAMTRHAFGLFLLIGLCLPAQPAARPLPVVAPFAPEMLALYGDAKTTPDAKERIALSFRPFTPTTPEQLDWVYQAVRLGVPLPELAREKLAAVTDPALIARSRHYLTSTDRETRKCALAVVEAKQDREAIPVLHDLLQDKTISRDHYLVKMALARLQDPVLLGQLLDPASRSPDSTVEMMNRELLKQYGDGGMAQLLATEPQDEASQKFVNNYLGEIKDPKQVQDLIDLYRKAKSDERRDALVHSLCRVNSRECQPLLREILATPAKDRAWLSDSLYHVVRERVWRYNIEECKAFRAEFMGELVRDPERYDEGYYQVLAEAGTYPHMGDQEARVALLLASHLNGPNGLTAAKSLQQLTGQQFQFSEPKGLINRDEANRDRMVNGRTVITREYIDHYRERELATLAEYRKTLDTKWAHLPQEERDRRYDDLKKRIEGTVQGFEKMLRTPPLWERGIPMDQALPWLENHYHLKAEAQDPK